MNRRKLIKDTIVGSLSLVVGGGLVAAPKQTLEEYIEQKAKIWAKEYMDSLRPQIMSGRSFRDLEGEKVTIDNIVKVRMYESHDGIYKFVREIDLSRKY